MKKWKKPNMGTFMSILEKDGKFVYGSTEVNETANGYFIVIKDGVSRIYNKVNDAWRAV